MSPNRKLEVLALAISHLNGAFDCVDSKAFITANPGLLKTYRPEKQCDGEHVRIFTSIMGGFKALVADLQAKCNGKNNRLTPDNTLGDMLTIYGFNTTAGAHKVTLFVRRALQDPDISVKTKISYFIETELKEGVVNG